MKFQKRGRTRYPRAFFSIALPIITFALALWVCVMGLITELTANELVQQAAVAATDYSSTWGKAFNTIEFIGINKASPGYTQVNRLLNANSWTGRPWINHLIDPSFPFINEPSSSSYFTSDFFYLEGQYAIRYTDSNGKSISSGNYLYFPYMSEDRWYEEKNDYEGLAYVDLSYYGISRSYDWTDTARLTGYFDGSEFILLRLETVSGPEYDLPSMRYALEWDTQYVDPPLPEEGMVVIYTSHLSQIQHDIGGAVTVGGHSYKNLLELMDYSPGNEYDIQNTVVHYDSSFVDRNGELITMSFALRVNPLAFTLRKLCPFYICCFLIVAVAVLLILLNIRRNLIKPVGEMAYWSTGKLNPLPMGGKSKWHEPRILQENYAIAQQAAHDAQIEITQLRTALEYSQHAEEHRRQMLSNITHELKTPLAIIHSYTEGLRDGIAGDKQDQYLGVILEETQRMDAMVLEMLDLSRLEAGKVRLASDQFSLLALTRSIFDKLQPLADEKDLQLEYDLVEDFQITADESRIGQVITNFATNAVKYSPEGGRIWIKVYRRLDKTIFSVENQCEPLSEEALTHVWESFYRVEQSRTTKGTGLGLTIAKAIIELHGGTCHAINTSEGVEFRFILP